MSVRDRIIEKQKNQIKDDLKRFKKKSFWVKLRNLLLLLLLWAGLAVGLLIGVGYLLQPNMATAQNSALPVSPNPGSFWMYYSLVLIGVNSYYYMRKGRENSK